MKVKQFDNEPWCIERDINKWLKENQGIEIMDIKYSIGVSNEGSHGSCLIFYEEVAE